MAVKEKQEIRPFEIYFYDHRCGERIIVLEYTNHEFEYRAVNGKYAEICPKCGEKVLVDELKEIEFE